MDDEIRQRLASLKGVDPANEIKNKNSIIFAKDTRSDQQKIDDMIKQFEEEVILDTGSGAEVSVDPIIDIETRLAKLKGDSTKSESKSTNSVEIPEDEDEITQVDNILKRVISLLDFATNSK